MRIAYVTMLWPAASETFAARDVRALIRQGHDVEVYSLRPDFRNTNELKKTLDVTHVLTAPMRGKALLCGFKNMVAHPCQLFTLGKALWATEKRPAVLLKSILLWPSVFYAWSQILKNKPDMVHLFWGHYPAMVGWLLHQTSQGIPFTMFLGPYDLQYHYGLTEEVAKCAQAIITHASDNVPVLSSLGIGKDKIHVIFRGIDMQKPLNEYPKVEGRFVFVGRLIRAKGIYEMADIFSVIRKRMPYAQLHVVGDGKERAAFEGYLKEHQLDEAVDMTGWLPPEQVMSELTKAEAMLFFSHSERLPNAVKEAMLYGVVPFSTATIGMEDIIDHNVNGFIVDPRQVDKVASLIVETIGDKQKMKTLSFNAIQTIKERFDVNVSMARYIKIWEECLAMLDRQGGVLPHSNGHHKVQNQASQKN